MVKCEICGHSSDHELVSHVKEHGMSVQEYQAEYPDAPLLGDDLREYLSGMTIRLDSDGYPWRLVSELEDIGVQAFGHIVPHATCPVLDRKFKFDRKVTRLLYFAIECNQRALLVGPPGTGKSKLIENLCSLLGWGFRRVNFNGQATPRTFFGGLRAGIGGETYFQYGDLPQAMRRGEVLVMDEISFIDADMAAGLHEPMEVGGRLKLSENGGEVINPHPMFRIVGTDNVGCQGDMFGRYHGTKALNSAFMDRWSIQIKVDYMTKSDETSVLVAKTPGLPRVLAEIMTELAEESRDQAVNEEILQPISFRQLLDWAALAVQHRSIGIGWRYAVLNKASEEDAGALSTLFSHKFPEVDLGE